MRKTAFLVVIFSIFLLNSIFISVSNVQGWQGNNDMAGNDYKSLYHAQPVLTEQNRGILRKVSKLQIPFIENKGQMECEDVKYYAKTFGGTVFITKDGEIVYSMPNFKKGQPTNGWVIKERFAGISTSDVKGEQESATKINFFKGQNRSKWIRQVRTYNLINIGEIYQGITLKLKAHGKNIEKLFYVKAGENPDRIKINIDGAKCLKVDENGELSIETGAGVVKFTKPIAYQQEDGNKKFVDVAYLVNNYEYSFKVGDYDNKKKLIIDPLLSSTYLGGAESDYPCSIAIASNGSVYVAGSTWSSNFPTNTGAYGNTPKEAFISKFDGKLENLLASTYIEANCVWSIAINTSGNPYVAGWTWSPNFPTTGGAYDGTLDGYRDAFISKFDENLQNLLASTYLGGGSYDCARSLSLDKSGNVVVVGQTCSSDFPTTANAYDKTYNGQGDVFVSKFDGKLENLLASTYLGGSGCEWGYFISLDSSGNAYIAGSTSSSDFPVTPNAYDTTYNGGNYDAFVSKLDGDLQTALASSYLGGSAGYEYARSISLDSSGNTYIAGSTSSSDFPVTPGSYDTIYNGQGDAFVSKFDGKLEYLLASTYLGGSGSDWGYFIKIDTPGNVYLVGATSSSDFPVTSGAYDTTYNGGSYDAFVSKLDGDLQTVPASSYLGDTGHYDHARSIIIDNTGDVYVTGLCSSSDFPVTPTVYDRTYNGGRYDVFVSKLDSKLSLLEPSVIKVPTDYTTIQQAILAAKYGDAIQVAQGVYAENIAITSSKDISIQGGWSQDFTSRSDDSSLTIIDGGGSGSVINISANTGVTIKLTIDGLTIQNGTAERGGGIWAVAQGTGTRIALTVTRCTISHNTSTDRGGGLYLEAIEGLLKATITNSTISSNRTKLEGGGLRLSAFMGGSATLNMVNDSVQDNIVEEVDGGGIAVYGAKAGVSNLILSKSIVTRNQGPNGGGVFGYAWGQDAVVLMTLKNNLITNNYASLQGGAIFACSGITDPTFSEAGGAITWDLTNNTITANSAGIHGAGGIKMYSGSNYGAGGSMSLNLKNDILWGNTDDYGNQEVVVAVQPETSGSASAIISYSDVGLIQTIGKGQYSTDNVIFEDPGFKNAAEGDYHLTEGSPCIDTGTSEGAPATDIGGTLRPQGNGYDMGAYEYVGAPILDIYFPHITSHIKNWETEICVINTSATHTSNGVFKAYNNAGVFISEINAVTLAPHGRREITVGDEFINPANIGYIIFESNSSAVAGYTKFYIEGQYRVAVPAVSEINTGDIYISHIASNPKWGTGINLLNTTSSPKTLTIEFDDGTIKTKTLAANEHNAFMIRHLFGGQSQPDIHCGVIKDASGIIGQELFTSGVSNIMSGILLNGDTTTTIYYPHTASVNGWGTGIQAYNPSATDCDITITPYTEAGVALTPVEDTIVGKKQYADLVSRLGFPLDTAWLKIDSTDGTSPITGFELFANKNLLAGYTGVGITGTEGIFAKLEKDGATGIAFVNIENSAAIVTLTAYNDIGTVIATETINLVAHEKAGGFAEAIFTGDISNATYVTYSSDREVVGSQINASSDGMMLDGLPGM